MRIQLSLSLLDLRCASGGVLQHFPSHESNIEVHGADINVKNIARIKKYLESMPYSIQELNTTEISSSLFAEEILSGKVVFVATDYPTNNTNIFHLLEYIKSE